jgi:hypothetical protein
MAPVLSASAWVMLARGVVGARIDTSKESRPTPRRLSQSTCTRWSTYSVMLMRTTLGSTSLSRGYVPPRPRDGPSPGHCMQCCLATW